LFLERVFYPGDRRDYPRVPPLFMLPRRLLFLKPGLTQ